MTYSIWKRLLFVFVGTLAIGIGLAFAFQYAEASVTAQDARGWTEKCRK